MHMSVCMCFRVSVHVWMLQYPYHCVRNNNSAFEYVSVRHKPDVYNICPSERLMVHLANVEDELNLQIYAHLRMHTNR